MADYKIKFTANIDQFSQQIDAAGKQFHQFSGDIKTSAQKIELGFGSLIKSATVVFGAVKAAKGIFEGFSNTINSTRSSQESWRTSTESMKVSMDVFNRALMSGNWDDFFTSVKNAIRLTEDFQTILNNFSTDQIKAQFKILAIEVDIAKLEAERAKFEDGTKEWIEITQKIQKLQESSNLTLEDLAKQSQNAAVAKFKVFSQEKQTDIEFIKKLFDKESAEYKKLQDEKIKHKQLVVNSQETEPPTMGQKHQSNVKTSAAREAEKELAAREKSEDILVRISKEMSEMTDEQLKSVFDLYEISKKYEKQIAENQKKINEENLKAAKKAADEQQKAAKDLADYEEKKTQERLKAEVDAHDLRIRKEMDAEDGRGRVKKIKATATPTSVTSKLPTRKITTPPKERSQNPFVSDTDIAKYDIIQQKITNLQQAIAVTTQLYGAQSQQVQTLQSQLAELQPPVNFAEGIQAVSTAFDTLANSVDGISDNPAIKALAFSLHLLAGAAAIASAKTWPEYIIASAAVAASIISFASSIKGQSFAGGGIVGPAPAAVGDQVNIRANPGEMILNNRQQTRLFNLVNGQKEQSANNQVVFRLQGQELVGLINNYSKKHS